jgi:hypothetical protein
VELAEGVEFFGVGEVAFGLVEAGALGALGEGLFAGDLLGVGEVAGDRGEGAGLFEQGQRDAGIAFAGGFDDGVGGAAEAGEDLALGERHGRLAPAVHGRDERRLRYPVVNRLPADPHRPRCRGQVFPLGQVPNGKFLKMRKLLVAFVIHHATPFAKTDEHLPNADGVAIENISIGVGGRRACVEGS